MFWCSMLEFQHDNSNWCNILTKVSNIMQMSIYKCFIFDKYCSWFNVSISALLRTLRLHFAAVYKTRRKRHCIMIIFIFYSLYFFFFIPVLSFNWKLILSEWNIPNFKMAINERRRREKKPKNLRENYFWT